MVSLRLSSSSLLLPHKGWRCLRKLLPGRVWSFLYSLRERLLAGRWIEELAQDLSGLLYRPRVTTLDYTRSLEQSWEKFEAVGKTSSNFAGLYAELLASPPPDGFRNILEIGVFDGGGHRAWAELFPESNVWGFDIDPTTVFSEGKITTFLGDQLSEDSLSRVVGSLPKSLDLIIDDGWHQPEAALKSMKFLLPLLGEGGYYVVEDIDWRKYRKVWLKAQRALSATFFTSLIPLRTNASERSVGGSYALFVLRRR